MIGVFRKNESGARVSRAAIGRSTVTDARKLSSRRGAGPCLLCRSARSRERDLLRRFRVTRRRALPIRTYASVSRAHTITPLPLRLSRRRAPLGRRTLLVPASGVFNLFPIRATYVFDSSFPSAVHVRGRVRACRTPPRGRGTFNSARPASRRRSRLSSLRRRFNWSVYDDTDLDAFHFRSFRRTSNRVPLPLFYARVIIG